MPESNKHSKLRGFLSSTKALAPSHLVYWLSGRRTSGNRLSAEELAAVEWGSLGKRPPSLQPGPGDQVSPNNLVSVGTWNIQYGLKYGRIAAALTEELNAGVYLIQESDVNARRSRFRPVASLLALGAVSVT